MKAPSRPKGLTRSTMLRKKGIRVLAEVAVHVKTCVKCMHGGKCCLHTQTTCHSSGFENLNRKL
jgi:hypothetical protein